MIVVDTSVWIDFLAERGTPHDLHLVDLIRSSAPVALTDLIYCEVLQGIRDDLAYRRVRELLRAFPILEVRGLETFEHAADIHRACRRKGLTIRRTADCLIAAVCLEAGAAIFHNDGDFDAIAKGGKLRVHRVESPPRSL